MKRQMLASMLLVTLTWTTTWSAAPTLAQESPRVQPTYAEASEQFSGFMNRIEDLRSHIDRSQFDTAGLLEETDYDPDRIIQFVADEISYQHYLGFLRGPKGTLISRAGNTLDQAVLLASLLKDSGFEARVVEGKLQDSDAQKLFYSMRASSGVLLSPFQDKGRLMEDLSALGGFSGYSQEETAAAIDLILEPSRPSPQIPWALDLRDDLISQISRAGIFQNDDSGVARLIQEARDYHWVEYRTEASGPWIEVHPASHGLDLHPQRGRILSNEVPQDLVHQIEVQLLLEQQIGAKTTTIPITGRWTSPAASLYGDSFSVQLVPDTLLNIGAEGLNIEDTFQKASVFFPLINGKPANGGLAFDLNGNTVDPFAASHPAAGFFSELADSANEATKAISQLGANQDTSAPTGISLRRVWIEVSLIGPADVKQSFVREIFNEKKLGSDWRQGLSGDDTKASIARMLAQESVFFVIPGALSATYLWDRNLQEYVRTKPLLQHGLANAYGIKPDGSHGYDTTGATPKPLSALNTFEYIDSQLADLLTDQIHYRPEATVVAVHRQLVGQDTLEITFDIVNNTRRVLLRDGKALRLSREGAVLAGVWETVVEAFPSWAGAEGFSAAGIWTEMAEQGVPVEWLDRPSNKSIPGEAFKEADFLDRNLAKGFALLGPADPQTDSPQQAWWRVDPSTGETLGIFTDGKGMSLVSYRLLLKAAAAGLIVFLGCYSFASDTPGKGLACAFCAAFAFATVMFVGMVGAYATALYEEYIVIVTTRARVLLPPPPPPISPGVEFIVWAQMCMLRLMSVVCPIAVTQFAGLSSEQVGWKVCSAPPPRSTSPLRSTFKEVPLVGPQ